MQRAEQTAKKGQWADGKLAPLKVSEVESARKARDEREGSEVRVLVEV